MSTSIAIATAANTQAMIAQQQADHAAKVACEAMMPAYTHQGATVELMHAYADCVNKVYPNPMSHDSLIALKIAVALLFIGMIVGAWYDRNDYDGPLMGAAKGFVIVLVAETCLFLIAAGLVFLFS